MKVISQSKITWTELLSNIRVKFGDDNLFFTFIALNNKHEPAHQATFSKDNFTYFDTWRSEISQAFENEKIMALTFVCRVFLSETIRVVNPKGNYVELPKNKVYHFLFTRDKINLFSVKETLQSQNTDAKSGKPIDPEPGLSYGSSIQLLEEMSQDIINK